MVVIRIDKRGCCRLWTVVVAVGGIYDLLVVEGCYRLNSEE